MDKEHFRGIVKMFNEEILIDKRTKLGYEKVLSKIDPLLCGWASRVYMPGYDFDDIKQEASIIAIEGIEAFDPEKNVKLSSFLTTHIKNKIISKLKSVNKLSNDASLVTISEKTCSCKSPDFSQNICNNCNLTRDSRYRSSREEYSFSSLNNDLLTNSGEYVSFENSISNSDCFYSDDVSGYDEADLSIAINRLRDSIDPMTFDILKMVWLDGHSIKYAAQEVGISGWGASMRLKKLSKNRVIKDLLSDIELRELKVKYE